MADYVHNHIKPYRDPNSHRRAGWQFAKLVSQGLHFTDNARQEANVGC
jgi:hypothetical protein